MANGSSVLRSIRLFVYGVLGRFIWWAPSFLLDPFDLYDRYLKARLPLHFQWDLDLPFGWFLLFLGTGLVGAAVATYHELRIRVNALEDRLTRKLEIVFENGGAFEQVDPLGQHNVDRRLFRVAVENTGGTTTDDVRVRLERMVPLHVGLSQDSPLHPIELRQMHDRPMAGQPLSREFSLNPGERRFIDVVWMEEDGIIGDDHQIVLCYAVPDVPNTIPLGSYELHIMATAHNVQPRRRAFIVDVNDHGRLSFQAEEA